MLVWNYAISHAISFQCFNYHDELLSTWWYCWCSCDSNHNNRISWKVMVAIEQSICILWHFISYILMRQAQTSCNVQNVLLKLCCWGKLGVGSVGVATDDWRQSTENLSVPAWVTSVWNWHWKFTRCVDCVFVLCDQPLEWGGKRGRRRGRGGRG